MSKIKLNQIFKEERLWKHSINSTFSHIIQSTRSQNFLSTPCRTLNSILNHIFGGYTCISPAISTLYAFCKLLKNNPRLKIYSNYLSISSEMATNLENTLLQTLDFPNIDTQAFNIVFYHVPKGKSYLKNVLDTIQNLTRLKQIETYCIANTQHFIRIYRNFNASGNNTITIFSDQYNDHMLHTLCTMFPHLMDITPCTSDAPLSAKEQLYNKRVETLYQIFDILYKALISSIDQLYPTNEITAIASNLTKLTAEYAELFDFVSEYLDSFTKKLAHIKNAAATAFFEKELKSAKNTIIDYEKRLTDAYNLKMRVERQLILNKMATEEDIKPFTETIKNTKAIELLTTTENEMILRITAPLQYFQSSDFEAYEKNPNSTYSVSFKNDSTLKRIFHKIFITREYKILFQAIIHVYIQDNYCNNCLHFYAEKVYSNPNLTEFPNPHLYHHDCWGAAKAEMNKNICEGNYELVIMQMVAAVQSMNIAENASFVNGFLTDIKTSRNLRNLITFIIDTPEGPAKYSYNELLDYEQALEKQEILDQAKEILAQPSEKYTQIELPDTED